MTMPKPSQLPPEEAEKARHGMEAQQQYLQAALCVLQERINEVELARTLLWKEKERYALQWEQAKQDREALDHRLEMCQQETDNYALACIQVQQQMESLTLATEHAEKEKEGYMRSREDFQRDVDGLQLQLAQLAKEQEKVEAQKTAYSLVLQEKKELLTQLKSAREEVAILKSSQQDMQLTLQKLYQEQQLVVSTQEASSKEREFSQVMYRKMLEQQRETQDQLQEKLRMEKQEWELKRLALEKELSDLTFACAAKDRDTRMAQQALARLQSELADTNAGLLASEKQRLELKARLDALELDNLDLGMGLRREQAQNADLRSEVGVLQAEAGDLRNTVVAQEGIFKKRMEVQAVDQSAAWMETVKSRHIAERRQQAVLIENLEKEKRALETHVLQVGHEMEELKHRHQLQTRELERQVEAKERERHLMEERLELWRAEFITHGTSSSADSQLSPVELPVSSGAVERRSPTSSPKQRGDALDFSSIPTGVAHQLMGRLADSEESKREFHAVRRRVEQLVNKALLADKPEEAPLVIDPVAAAIPDFLALGPQHFRAVPVTLGQLVQLRCLFTEIDVQGVGAIDAEGLAGWCTMRGMQQVLFPHLEAFIAAADVWQRGTIGFWGWVALQTYLLRDLRAQGVGIAEWVAFCTQEPYR